MATDEPVGTTTLELYVRSLTPWGSYVQQEDVIGRLERLVETGAISAFDVVVWGDRIGPSTAAARTRRGAFVLDRVDRFREWAGENGASVDPYFPVERVTSSITGEDYTTLRLPLVALAAFRGDDLQWVVPCDEAAGRRTVSDRLHHLERTAVAADPTVEAVTDGESAHPEDLPSQPRAR